MGLTDWLRGETPQEQVRRWQRTMRTEMRAVDRQIMGALSWLCSCVAPGCTRPAACCLLAAYGLSRVGTLSHEVSEIRLSRTASPLRHPARVQEDGAVHQGVRQAG